MNRELRAYAIVVGTFAATLWAIWVIAWIDFLAGHAEAINGILGLGLWVPVSTVGALLLWRAARRTTEPSGGTDR